MSGEPTGKQLAFANAVIAGMGFSEAYRAAYDAGGMSAASVAKEAHALLRNPKIAPIIAQGRRDAARSAAWSRETALERLEAVNAAAYSRMMETAPEKGFQGADVRAFFESMDRAERLRGTIEFDKAFGGLAGL